MTKEKALNKWCWQILHPEADEKPPVCEKYCLAKHDTVPPTPEELEIFKPELCAVVRWPSPQKGAIIWAPSRNKPAPVESDPREDLLVRGCLSVQVGDIPGTLDFIRRYCAADDCELFVADARQNEVVYSGCEGPDRDVFGELTSLPFGAGYPGSVTSRQIPMYTNDFQNERLFLRDGVRQRGLRSFLGIPLAENGEPLGYLGLGWRDASIPAASLIRRLEGVKSLLHAGLIQRRPALLGQDKRSGSSLSVRCLGSFEVVRNGITLPMSSFARRKSLALLKILLLKAPHPVHRDVLINHLWPESEGPSGRNKLHGVVHALRAAVEPREEATYIQNEQDFYFFNTRASHFVDLFYFQQLLRAVQAEKLPLEKRSSYLESAVALYRGDLFSEDPYHEWLEAPRVLLRRQYVGAVRTLVRQRGLMGRLDENVTTLQSALLLYPYIEELQQELIRTLVILDRRSEAREQMKFCLHSLTLEYDLEPLSETIALARDLGVR
ncbi:MAG TPA: BTAD domain-containing putative transcriptional regulator [Pseudobdellovibrionaceae bacterium]|nr:BTAD domain-containing putative transcriptional regulator [Pseudobdellovibrionaceae bacterium]